MTSADLLLAAAATVVRDCRRIRRRCFESVGDARYSRPASDNLDEKLQKYLDFRGGYFVEAGANDGFLQSNTYYLEKMCGWRGILVEPVPELYARCRSERRRSVVVNAALVSPAYAERDVTLHFFNTMSYTEGAFTTPDAERSHRAEAAATQIRKRTYTLRAPAKTLSAVLDEHGAPASFDLLSLDLEGFEVQALRGLDFERHRPAYILIEGNDLAGVRAVVSGLYEELEQVSTRDFLFRLRRFAD